MGAAILLGIGLVLAIEGLALALLPGRVEEALAMIARLAPEVRRLLGLAALASGVVLVALARIVGA